MNYKALGISSMFTFVVGLSMALLVITSENGYIGGMVFGLLFFALLFLVPILLIFTILGFTLENKTVGFCLLISTILLPASFIAVCVFAKYFEIGAYRQEPMIPFPVSKHNKDVKEQRIIQISQIKTQKNIL
jgi:hypothetical protein